MRHQKRKLALSIGIIGSGVMGAILAERALASFPKAEVIVFSTNRTQLRALKCRLARITIAGTIDDLRPASMIFLAVKPQDFSAVSFMPSRHAVIVSIMAGVSMRTIQRQVRSSNIIRAMPNVLARIRQGFTVWTAGRSVSGRDRTRAASIFAAMGDHMYVAQETLIDKATAITGSGPAYIFATLLAFERAASALGFSAADARRMVRSVIIGSTAIAAHYDVNDLIAQVASKKGTTEAALDEFSKHHFAAIWQCAVRAAYRRARKMRR